MQATKHKTLTAVPVLADAKKPTMSEGRPLAVDRTESGEARESITLGCEEIRTGKPETADSRGGSQKPLRTPQFQAFLDSLEPQPWKRKKLTVNWATCHFNPVPK